MSFAPSFPFELDIEDSAVTRLSDWSLPKAFAEERHLEKIRGSPQLEHTWRMKERMKTVSVALVLCLNVGVDPPDIMKTQPCAKNESWVDPLSMSPQKALEAIGGNLQKQYERWQPRARYKQSLDPTVDEVKKLCTSLRRNAKEERVLFHYNGHGVPKPTVNGEIWVFNRSYTQYIPLSLYDLQQWMGSPSIYVYDCSCAGQIVESFNQFAVQHEREYAITNNGEVDVQCPEVPIFTGPPSFKNCIQLAACASDQLLPMNPDLPADLFTACLTTPIKIALQWFILHNSVKLLPGITLEILDKIPGQLTDRRTMLGELNWIFTAITDTIAWNALPTELFQRLFRQDLLVASLFRNFLLADRIMRSYNCTPVSSPRLPSTCHHPMWQAWDLAVDLCLSQLPSLLEEGSQAVYQHSQFFSEQLTAFQVWLTIGPRIDSRPEQLPIVLQVLLSQVHRLRALDLLGRFLDLGPHAVNLALSVGIFPYVLKLLQSSARELRPLLVFIWAKILAVDGSCQTDLIRDNGHKYFLAVLSDNFIPAEHRTMAAFVMACIVRNYPMGQEVVRQCNLVDICLVQLNDANALLRQWLALCLGLVWEKCEAARWIGARDSADEKLALLLSDPVPEVRAAAVYALGTFINSAIVRTDQANTTDHKIGIILINAVANDGSPLVRKELVVALQWLILLFENNFVVISSQAMDDEKSRESPNEFAPIVGTPPLHGHGLRKVASRDRLMKLMNCSVVVSNNNHSLGNLNGDLLSPPNNHLVNMKRVNSSNSLTTGNNSSSCIGNVYLTIWKAAVALTTDPCPEVTAMAKVVVNEVITKRTHNLLQEKDSMRESHSDPSYSAPSSPRSQSYLNESPPTGNGVTPNSNPRERMLSESAGSGAIRSTPSKTPSYHGAQFFPKRPIFGKEPSITEDEATEDGTGAAYRQPLVSTEFVGWCAKYFSKPVIKYHDQRSDPESVSHQEKEWRTIRNTYYRKAAKEELLRLDPSRTDELLFCQRNSNLPNILAFHPFEPHLIVAERDSFSTWLWDPALAGGGGGCGGGSSYYNPPAPLLLGSQSNFNQSNARITAFELINPHDLTLLMFACDDGSVKVWKSSRGHGDRDSSQSKLVTSFQMFTDMQSGSKSPGTLLYWEQETCHLIAGGDSKVIRIWDSSQEMKVRDMVTGPDASPVTSLSSDGAHLICAGCQDGSVRIFDDRLYTNDTRVITFREHKNPLLKSHIFPDSSGKHFHVISGCTDGIVHFWDKRLLPSIKTMTLYHSMTAMSVHQEADVFACSTSASGATNIYTLDGIAGSVIPLRNHEGFMSQRASISALAFHPLRINLAAGSTDNFISIYSPKSY